MYYLLGVICILVIGCIAWMDAFCSVLRLPEEKTKELREIFHYLLVD